MINMMDVKKFIEDNPKLVTCKHSIRYPELSVVKYSRRVFYDSSWNDILEECRGLIVDNDYKVVAAPFKKIYNRGERDTDIPMDEKVVYVRKVNGFMAAVTRVDGYANPIVSTTGSLDSPYVEIAEKYISKIDPKCFNSGTTYLYEIVDPSDPHIVPEMSGAYLIGARYHDRCHTLLNVNATESALDMFAEQQKKVLRPSWYTGLFSEVVDRVKTVKHEGFVVHGETISLKIKSPYYLFNKFVARCKNTDKLLNPDIKKNLDEEYYPLISVIHEHIDIFTKMNEQDRLEFVRNFLGDSLYNKD